MGTIKKNSKEKNLSGTDRGHLSAPNKQNFLVISEIKFPGKFSKEWILREIAENYRFIKDYSSQNNLEIDITPIKDENLLLVTFFITSDKIESAEKAAKGFIKEIDRRISSEGSSNLEISFFYSFKHSDGVDVFKNS